MNVLITVALFWTAAAVSPGPAFLVVVHESLARGRSSALKAVAGLSVGLGSWGLASLFGLRAILRAVPELSTGLRFAGAGYLAYLGITLLRKTWRRRGRSQFPQAAKDGSDPPDGDGPRGFLRGLFTNLTNPKTMVLSGSLFAVVLPKDLPLPLGLASVAVIVGVAGSWFLLVTLFLARPRYQRLYQRHAPKVDVASGLAFLSLGLLMLVVQH